MKKFVFYGIFAFSLLVNLSVILLFSAWLSGRIRPIQVDPGKMRDIIKEKSWNSAGTWRVVEHDRNAIIIEYKLPIYDITRYKLSKRDFRLNVRHETTDGSFGLSFDGCDVLARSENGGEFECMKFRDLSPKEEDCK